MNWRAAPAKINLALHVTGQRLDGFHLLDSLVCFADFGDRVRVEQSTTLSLDVTGPMAKGVPTDVSNLVLRAATLFGNQRGARIILDKHLPMASGIGGGSADAAACLHLLAELWNCPLPDAAKILALGADIPVCLAGKTVHVRGIGEQLEAVKNMPTLPAVLVNSGQAVPTPQIFKSLSQKNNAAMQAVSSSERFSDWMDFLSAQRNDLEEPARLHLPQIGTALQALETSKDCSLARMSGSGATCFGIFETRDMAQNAAQQISEQHPDWWVKTVLLG